MATKVATGTPTIYTALFEEGAESVAFDQKDPENRSASAEAPGGHRLSVSAASAVRRSDLHATGERETDTSRVLQELTDTALTLNSLDALLPELLEQMRAATQADIGAILLLDDHAHELEVVAAHEVAGMGSARTRIPVGVGFAGRIAAECVPLAVDDLAADTPSVGVRNETRCPAIGAPLLVDGRLLGVVYVGSTSREQFTAAQTALFEQMAARTARAVERAQLLAEAKTARWVAEQRAAFLSTTLEALGDGIMIADANGHVLFGNPAFSALLGAAPATAEGDKTPGTDVPPATEYTYLPELDVRDAEGHALAASDLALARALRGEKLAGPSALDVQIRRLDGPQAFLNISGAPVRDSSGTVIGAVMAVRDVTERRRLEQQAHAATHSARERAGRLEAIFSAVADGLFVYDAEGRILERNPAADAMLAAFAPPTSHEESVLERGRHIAGGLRDAAGQRLPEDQWPQSRIARGEVLSGQTSVDIRMRRADGSDAYLNVSGAPLHGENGEIVGSVCLYRNLTERWELNETLRQRTHDLEAANARLRTLVEVLPIGVAIVDAAGKPQLVNDALRQIWGNDLPIAESMTQYGDYRAVRPETGKPVGADEWGLVRALRGGTVSVNEEYDIQTFGGQLKTILDSAAPLHDENGVITGAVSVVIDITERKRQSERTREALEAFIAITRTLVEAPDDADDARDARAAGVATPDGEDATFSERRREESPLARRLAELTRGILGCSRVAVNAVEEVDGRLLDRPVAIVGMTPEQENQWWAEQLALRPREFGTGMLPEDRDRLLRGEVFTADLTRPPYNLPNDYGVTAILAAAMRTQGRTVGLLALDFEDPGRQPHVFTPEEIQIAEAVARLGAVVLERDRLLGEREAARAEVLALAEANRRMDEFLGIAGHELRTPLTTVKANLQLARRRAEHIVEAQALPQAPQEHRPQEHRQQGRDAGVQLLRMLERAAQSVERQERLVQDLLDVSRIAAGRLEYRMERRELVSLVREAVDEQRVNHPTRQIDLIDLDAAAGAPDAIGGIDVTVDADRIGQVFANLLTNALKYSPPEQPVQVTLRRESKRVRVAVRDRGPGLSPAQQRLLFERFYRVPGVEVLSGSGVGLGLGLYISKTIIEQHSGEIGVESTVGEGSTFWFTVPLDAH